MAYTGRAPSAAPLTSADINDGAVAPADLSTGAPSWTAGGAVTLPYNGSNKLATTSTGIDVTGTVTADGLTISDTAPTIQLTNSTTGADAFIDADSSFGSFNIKVDNNNEVASSNFSIWVDGTRYLRADGTGDISF